ncbi:hypothetical protein TNCV_161121 [Trichonephila clavipes]|nr:hypothetical protein TNCV_161121 [Trichonephila clavipes]
MCSDRTNWTVRGEYMGNKTTERSIVDAEIFSGFVPNEDDLKKLQNDSKHLIEMYETSRKGIVFYLKTYVKEQYTP